MNNILVKIKESINKKTPILKSLGFKKSDYSKILSNNYEERIIKYDTDENKYYTIDYDTGKPTSDVLPKNLFKLKDNLLVKGNLNLKNGESMLEAFNNASTYDKTSIDQDKQGKLEALIKLLENHHWIITCITTIQLITSIIAITLGYKYSIHSLLLPSVSILIMLIYPLLIVRKIQKAQINTIYQQYGKNTLLVFVFFVFLFLTGCLVYVENNELADTLLVYWFWFVIAYFTIVNLFYHTYYKFKISYDKNGIEKVIENFYIGLTNKAKEFDQNHIDKAESLPDNNISEEDIIDETPPENSTSPSEAYDLYSVKEGELVITLRRIAIALSDIDILATLKENNLKYLTFELQKSKFSTGEIEACRKRFNQKVHSVDSIHNKSKESLENDKLLIPIMIENSNCELKPLEYVGKQDRKSKIYKIEVTAKKILNHYPHEIKYDNDIPTEMKLVCLEERLKLCAEEYIPE